MDNLFDIYVRDMETWFAGNEDMLSRLYVKADRINKIVQKSGLNQDKKDDSEYVLVNIANLYAEFNEKYTDLREMRVASEVTETALREKIKALEIENERLKRVKNNESVNVIASTVGIPDLGELSDNIERVLSLVESNVKAVSTAVYMKSEANKNTGNKSSRFISEIDTYKLIKDYTDNGYSITKEMLVWYKDRYNITYNGLRNRLINAKVWRGR